MTTSYEEIGHGIGILVTEKQAAYGDSFSKSGEVMRILWPHARTLTTSRLKSHSMRSIS